MGAVEGLLLLVELPFALCKHLLAVRQRGLGLLELDLSGQCGGFALGDLPLSCRDGLGTFLSPGQVLAAAFAVGPHVPDPRWGVFLGLVFYASLALLSVVARGMIRETRP